MSVELHGAFVWDCEECGRENYERAIEGSVDEAALLSDANQISGRLIAPEFDSDELGPEILVQCVVIAPKQVRCKHCGNSFATAIFTEDDDEATA